MELANSQAMVKVYIGDRNLATYHVPNNAGTLWDVCTYDIKTNTLTPVNKVYFHPGDSSNVGIEPIDLARNNLISNIAKYECYDFGPEKAEEIQQKLQDARNCVNSDVDYDTIVSCSNALEEYFRELEESTRISEIYAEDLRDTYIYRQGNYYYDEETDEENRLHGYSIIKLTGRSGEFSTELEIVLHQENASYDWTSISLESYYNIKYVVTEEEGQHYVSIMSNDVEVEKYPLYYERNIGSFEFSVTAEENTVTCQKDWEYDSDYNIIEIIRVEGVNEILTAPQFSSEEGVEIVYETVEDSETYVGKLTVSYLTQTQVYWVTYTQQ